MPRRLDLKPDKKLRNPQRHLRSLRRWAESFAGEVPAEAVGAGQSYRIWRVPIHAKLVTERHTTPMIQAAVLQSLVDAAENLRAAWSARHPPVPVAALVTYPFLFWSEIALFPAPDAFAGFDPTRVGRAEHVVEAGDVRVETGPPRYDIVRRHALCLPCGAKAGGYWLKEVDLAEPQAAIGADRWVIGWW